MKKRISQDEAERFIRKASFPDMDSVAKEHTKQVMLSTFGDVTNNNEQRYINKKGIFNYLFSRPMAPIIIALVMILSGAGTVLAADGARPGDMLYPLDKAMEQTRLNFTISDQAKAEFTLKVVEERQRERTELEVEQKNNLFEESDKDTNQALEHAQEVLNEVRVRQEEQNNERAREAIEEVGDKLNELQERHQERIQVEEQNEIQNQEQNREQNIEDDVDENNSDDNGSANANRNMNQNRNMNMNQNQNQNINSNMNQNGQINEEDDSEDSNSSNINSSDEGSDNNGVDDQNGSEENSNSDSQDDEEEGGNQ
ncbi:MAG: DUF5667 domain-containing protein [Patescibacteria group bacterium]